MSFTTQIHTKLRRNLLALVVLASFAPSALYAATVTYTLENLIQENGQQMTGTFDWVYTLGDFENGSAIFTELFIPGHGSDISALNITVAPDELDFSLAGNFHSAGVNVNLFLLTPFTETQSAFIDPTLSRYEIEVGASNGNFVSGSIEPSAIPVPSALVLFLSGLLATTGFIRRKTR